MTNRRVFGFVGVAAVILVVVGLLKITAVPVAGQASTTSAVKTAWGDPDLQGIWNQENNTPLQRNPKYADREFFTDAERAEFDRQRAAVSGRDRRAAIGTEKD